MAASKLNNMRAKTAPLPCLDNPGLSKPRGEVVCCDVRQIEKLVPQPQEATALGLLMRKDAPIKSSTKSISEPAR